MTDNIKNYKCGGCLCGAVRYEGTDNWRPISMCHCKQCRRTSGHFFAATSIKKTNFTLLNDKGLEWYSSSDDAMRGFCKICGSSLFWQHDKEEDISILAGSLDDGYDEDLTIRKHIFCQFKGGYYQINDDVPCYDING